MVAYMKCDDIQGDVTSTGHENWIGLRYAKFHLRTPVKTKVGDTN